MLICLTAVLDAVDLPVLVGSGVTADNYDQFRAAHAVVVGSHFKRNGLWSNELDPDRLRRFMQHVADVRRKQVETTMIM